MSHDCKYTEQTGTPTRQGTEEGRDETSSDLGHIHQTESRERWEDTKPKVNKNISNLNSMETEMTQSMSEAVKSILSSDTDPGIDYPISMSKTATSKSTEANDDTTSFLVGEARKLAVQDDPDPDKISELIQRAIANGVSTIVITDVLKENYEKTMKEAHVSYLDAVTDFYPTCPSGSVDAFDYLPYDASTVGQSVSYGMTVDGSSDEEDIEKYLTKYTPPEGSSVHEINLLNYFVQRATELAERENTDDELDSLIKDVRDSGADVNVIRRIYDDAVKLNASRSYGGTSLAGDVASKSKSVQCAEASSLASQETQKPCVKEKSEGGVAENFSKPSVQDKHEDSGVASVLDNENVHVSSESDNGEIEPTLSTRVESILNSAQESVGLIDFIKTSEKNLANRVHEICRNTQDNLEFLDILDSIGHGRPRHITESSQETRDGLQSNYMEKNDNIEALIAITMSNLSYQESERMKQNDSKIPSEPDVLRARSADDQASLSNMIRAMSSCRSTDSDTSAYKHNLQKMMDLSSPSVRSESQLENRNESGLFGSESSIYESRDDENTMKSPKDVNVRAGNSDEGNMSTSSSRSVSAAYQRQEAHIKGPAPSHAKLYQDVYVDKLLASMDPTWGDDVNYGLDYLSSGQTPVSTSTQKGLSNSRDKEQDDRENLKTPSRENTPQFGLVSIESEEHELVSKSSSSISQTYVPTHYGDSEEMSPVPIDGALTSEKNLQNTEGIGYLSDISGGKLSKGKKWKLQLPGSALSISKSFPGEVAAKNDYLSTIIGHPDKRDLDAIEEMTSECSSVGDSPINKAEDTLLYPSGYDDSANADEAIEALNESNGTYEDSRQEVQRTESVHGVSTNDQTDISIKDESIDDIVDVVCDDQSRPGYVGGSGNDSSCSYMASHEQCEDSLKDDDKRVTNTSLMSLLHSKTGQFIHQFDSGMLAYSSIGPSFGSSGELNSTLSRDKGRRWVEGVYLESGGTSSRDNLSSWISYGNSDTLRASDTRLKAEQLAKMFENATIDTMGEIFRLARQENIPTETVVEMFKDVYDEYHPKNKQPPCQTNNGNMINTCDSTSSSNAPTLESPIKSFGSIKSYNDDEAIENYLTQFSPPEGATDSEIATLNQYAATAARLAKKHNPQSMDEMGGLLQEARREGVPMSFMVNLYEDIFRVDIGPEIFTRIKKEKEDIIEDMTTSLQNSSNSTGSDIRSFDSMETIGGDDIIEQCLLKYVPPQGSTIEEIQRLNRNIQSIVNIVKGGVPSLDQMGEVFTGARAMGISIDFVKELYSDILSSPLNELPIDRKSSSDSDGKASSDSTHISSKSFGSINDLDLDPEIERFFTMRTPPEGTSEADIRDLNNIVKKCFEMNASGKNPSMEELDDVLRGAEQHKISQDIIKEIFKDALEAAAKEVAESQPTHISATDLERLLSSSISMVSSKSSIVSLASTKFTSATAEIEDTIVQRSASSSSSQSSENSLFHNATLHENCSIGEIPGIAQPNTGSMVHSFEDTDRDVLISLDSSLIDDSPLLSGSRGHSTGFIEDEQSSTVQSVYTHSIGSEPSNTEIASTCHSDSLESHITMSSSDLVDAAPNKGAHKIEEPVESRCGSHFTPPDIFCTCLPKKSISLHESLTLSFAESEFEYRQDFSVERVEPDYNERLIEVRDDCDIFPVLSYEDGEEQPEGATLDEIEALNRYVKQKQNPGIKTLTNSEVHQAIAAIGRHNEVTVDLSTSTLQSASSDDSVKKEMSPQHEEVLYTRLSSDSDIGVPLDTPLLKNTRSKISKRHNYILQGIGTDGGEEYEDITRPEYIPIASSSSYVEAGAKTKKSSNHSGSRTNMSQHSVFSFDEMVSHASSYSLDKSSAESSIGMFLDAQDVREIMSMMSITVPPNISNLSHDLRATLLYGATGQERRIMYTWSSPWEKPSPLQKRSSNADIIDLLRPAKRNYSTKTWWNLWGMPESISAVRAAGKLDNFSKRRGQSRSPLRMWSRKSAAAQRLAMQQDNFVLKSVTEITGLQLGLPPGDKTLHMSPLEKLWLGRNRSQYVPLWFGTMSKLKGNKKMVLPICRLEYNEMSPVPLCEPPIDTSCGQCQILGSRVSIEQKFTNVTVHEPQLKVTLVPPYTKRGNRIRLERNKWRRALLHNYSNSLPLPSTKSQKC